MSNSIQIVDNYTLTSSEKTKVQDGRYCFSTQNSGYDTVKTPMGMFNQVLIDNDLKAVDTAIRQYYGL